MIEVLTLTHPLKVDVALVEEEDRGALVDALRSVTTATQELIRVLRKDVRRSDFEPGR